MQKQHKDKELFPQFNVTATNTEGIKCVGPSMDKTLNAYMLTY